MKLSTYILLITLFTGQLMAKKPELTLVIVIDQFAYHELQKLKKHLTGGIGYMLNNGIVYEQCFMPHGLPQTGPGHASISTGALPKDHGFVANIWPDKDGKIVYVQGDANIAKTGVLGSENQYKTGKSAKNLRIDTLSDQLVLRSSPQDRCEAIALAMNSLPAIAMAGHAGTPFWFNSFTGEFTSSKAYMDSVPGWVRNFNSKHNIPELKSIKWELAYPSDSPAYQFNNIHNYEFAGSWELPTTERGVGATITIAEGTEKRFKMIKKVPKGAQLITEFAKTCIDTYVDYKKPDRLLLWVSYGSLDPEGHPFGPESMEAIDMIYHIDKGIQQLITYANKRFGWANVTIALTADHGIMPIPEMAHAEGYKPAKRINAQELVASINAHVKKKLHIDNLILCCLNNQLYVHHATFDALSPDHQKKALQEIKKYVTGIPGILRAWTYDELAKSNYELQRGDLEAYFRDQLMPGRSGEIILQVRPYVLLTYELHGTDHATPYDYDTHIPLMLYKKNAFMPKKVTERVYAQQLAPSLAYLLDIPRPSASTFKLLPGIEKD